MFPKWVFKYPLLLCCNLTMILTCILSQIQPLTQSFIYTYFHVYIKLPISTLQTLVLNPIISVLGSLLCTVKAIYFKWAKSSSSWPLLLNLEKETRISFSTRGIHLGVFFRSLKNVYFRFTLFSISSIYISKNETCPFVYYLLFISKSEGKKFYHSKFCWFYI